MPYGIVNGMAIKIDKSGRIVVPKPLRDRLRLKPDMELDVHEQVDGLWVHRGTAQANADWARILEDVRDERLLAVDSD